MPSVRKFRVRELLKRELGEILRREIPVETAGLVSIHDVIMSRDLRSATRSLNDVIEKIDDQGAGALIGGPKLPDYKP